MKKKNENSSIYIVYNKLSLDPQFGLETVKSFAEKVLGDTGKQSTASYYLSWLKTGEKPSSISSDKIDEINDAFKKYVAENLSIDVADSTPEGKVISSWRRAQKIKQLIENKNLLSEWAKQKASQISKDGDHSVSGSLGGIAAGASIGSLLGPIGTGIGAIIGGLAGAGVGSIDMKTKEYAAKLVNIGPSLNGEIEIYQESFLDLVHKLQKLNEQNQKEFESLKMKMTKHIKELGLEEKDAENVKQQMELIFESIPNFENFLGLPSAKFEEARLDVIANDLLDEIKSSKK